VKSAAFYIWAITRAIELRRNGDGGCRARAEQAIAAIQKDEAGELRVLCAEIERSFLHLPEGLDPMDQEVLRVAWGALALYTGYRSGVHYVDDHLATIAEWTALRAFDANPFKGMGPADERRHKSTPKYHEQRAAARQEARAAELARISAKRGIVEIQALRDRP
jgi:hypothetical protein